MNAVASHPPQVRARLGSANPSGNVAIDFEDFMAARTISELANWDGHLDQKRQSSKWARSSSIHARDLYQTSLDLEASQPSSTRLSDKKRAEKSSFYSNLGVRTFSTPAPLLAHFD